MACLLSKDYHAFTTDSDDMMIMCTTSPIGLRNAFVNTASKTRTGRHWLTLLGEAVASAWCVALAGVTRMHRKSSASPNLNKNPVLSTPMRFVHRQGWTAPGKCPHSAPLPSTFEFKVSETYLGFRERPSIATSYDSDDTVGGDHSHDMQVEDSPLVDVGDLECGQDRTCFLRPTRSAHSRNALASAANLLRDVYVHLVRHHVFLESDILETCGPLSCPSLDPMGVLFSAQTMLRHALTEEMLNEHNLDIQIREVIATVLLMCYKMRAESCWYTSPSGKSITVTIMSQFLTSAELPVTKQMAHTIKTNMEYLEIELLAKLPIMKLVDESAHSGFEWSLYEHYEQVKQTYHAEHRVKLSQGCVQAMSGWRDLQCSAHRQLMLALSGGYFFFHAACLNRDCDLLEDMAEWCDSVTIGKAIAFLCVQAIYTLRKDTTPPKLASRTTMRAAATLAFNAQRLSQQRVAGLRVFATECGFHPCHQLIGERALGRLCDSFI